MPSSYRPRMATKWRRKLPAEGAYGWTLTSTNKALSLTKSFPIKSKVSVMICVALAIAGAFFAPFLRRISAVWSSSDKTVSEIQNTTPVNTGRGCCAMASRFAKVAVARKVWDRIQAPLEGVSGRADRTS